MNEEKRQNILRIRKKCDEAEELLAEKLATIKSTRALAKKLKRGSLEKLRAEWEIEDYQERIKGLRKVIAEIKKDLAAAVRRFEDGVEFPISTGVDEKARSLDTRKNSRSAAFGKWDLIRDELE